LAPWALLGLFIALSKRGEESRLVAAVALTECLGIVLVMVTARYRLTTVAPLLLLVGLAAKTTFEVVSRKDYRQVLVLALGLFIAAIIVWPIPVRDTRSAAWHELGESWAAVGDVEAALDAYERSIDADPTNTGALEDLAQVLARRGERERARTHGVELERILRERGDTERADQVVQWLTDLATHQER
jgi:tetratricopeptide (TPR) repeat protein